jgi:hypothetical protein
MTESNTYTFDLSGCPCCGTNDPCDPPGCSFCTSQNVRITMLFSGVTAGAHDDCNVDCDEGFSNASDVAAFWNSTSFEIGCCSCECSETTYMNPDAPFEPGEDLPNISSSTGVEYFSDKIQVVVNPNSGCGVTDHCDGSIVTFELGGLSAPYDCSPGNIPFLSQADAGSGTEYFTIWSGASCTLMD